MDKIKSFSVCDTEKDGFWCEFEWQKGLVGGREENLSKRFSEVPSWRDPRAWDLSALRCAWVQFPGRTAPYRTHGHRVPAARPSLQSPVRRPEVRSRPAIASRELEASRGFRSTPASGPTMCLRAQLPALNAGPESW